MSDKVCLLIDGTAVYLRTREDNPDRQLDYAALNRVLLEAAAADEFESAIFFSTVDRNNAGQMKFLKFIESRVGWTVEAKPVWEADPVPRDVEGAPEVQRWIRFDASIAFALGRLAASGRDIVVVSDSYGLEPAVTAASVYGSKVDARVVFSFFGHLLDPRWYTKTRRWAEDGASLRFFDLDDVREELFGGAKTPRSSSQSRSALGSLP